MDTEALVRGVSETLAAGTRLLQYRNKVASPLHRRVQLRALEPICARFGCTLVVNDDWRAAKELGLSAIHIGAEDGDVAAVRAAMGEDMLLGVSCYADLDRARLVAPYADYLAFGSVFPSTTKPEASSAALGILRQARALGRPVVAIGGITVGNAAEVMNAGADAIAVISGIFAAESISEATRKLLRTGLPPQR
jgi:thiamine-phosphate pyrophosphorylase